MPLAYRLVRPMEMLLIPEGLWFLMLVLMFDCCCQTRTKSWPSKIGM